MIISFMTSGINRRNYLKKHEVKLQKSGLFLLIWRRCTYCYCSNTFSSWLSKMIRCILSLWFVQLLMTGLCHLVF